MRKRTKKRRGGKLWQATAKQRALTHYYKRPVQDVVLTRIAQGQSVTEVAESMSRESGVRVGKTALYRWIANWRAEKS